MKLWCPLLLASATLLAACATPPAVDSHARVSELARRVVDDAAATADFNGAVVLMRDGEVLFEQAVGLAQRNPDRLFSVDTPNDGGSLAKTLTAAAVWELVAEGRLSWSDRVTRFVPEYPYADQTLRDLLTHRNGLAAYGAFDADFAPGQVRDTTDLLRASTTRQPQPVFPQGVSAEYSDLGFDTAALVVERISGQRIESWWHERYLKPLDIPNLFARPARFSDWRGPRTVGYDRQAAGWALSDAFDGEGHIGASNVHASARDWARWGDAFARGRVMAPERLEAGLATPMLDSGLGHSLNLLSWYCDASRQRCHYTGQYNGFFSQVYWDRSRREVVAYVSNSSLAHWRRSRLTRELVTALAGRITAPEPSPVLNPIAKADRSGIAGLYESPTLGRLQIDVTADGRSFLRVNDGERVSLFALTEGVFYAPMLELWLGFTGPTEAPTLHLRSVFHVAEARRLPAPAPRLG